MHIFISGVLTLRLLDLVRVHSQPQPRAENIGTYGFIYSWQYNIHSRPVYARTLGGEVQGWGDTVGNIIIHSRPVSARTVGGEVQG